MNSFWKIFVVAALLVGPVFTIAGCGKTDPDKLETLTECVNAGYNDQECITIIQRNTARNIAENHVPARTFTSLQECELTNGVGQCGSPGAGTTINNTYITEENRSGVFLPLVAGMYLGYVMSDPGGHYYHYDTMPRPTYNRTTIIVVPGAAPPAAAATATQTLRKTATIAPPPPLRGGLGTTAKNGAVVPATVTPATPAGSAAQGTRGSVPDTSATVQRGGFGDSAKKDTAGARTPAATATVTAEKPTSNSRLPPPVSRSSGSGFGGGSKKR
jgi:uncharacterized protein YgiB involved in biofilm formation